VAVASSADGTKLVAVVNSGQIYTSTDAGVNWTARDSSRSWSDVASSADGTRLVATVDSGAGGAIYVSTNSGATWSLTSANTGVRWFSVASSADGLKLVANGGLTVYTSSDGGTNWIARQSIASQAPLACSADCSKVVALTGSITTGNNGAYVSSDSGVTWTRRLYSESTTAVSWSAAAISSDGATMVVGGLGRWYRSVDQGRSWSDSTYPAYLTTNGLALSSDGTRIAAATSAGLYTSAASGASTTTGVAGSISGGQYDSIELQYVGSGLFIVLNYTQQSATGFSVQ
jgi:photosystem II stability/assembly factor-like uncharacterized protein